MLCRNSLCILDQSIPIAVADCLETIEEIGMRSRDDFIKHGGEELILVPSLNSEDSWAESVVRIAFDREYSHELE